MYSLFTFFHRTLHNAAFLNLYIASISACLVTAFLHNFEHPANPDAPILIGLPDITSAA
jgi:hypothetical protein